MKQLFYFLLICFTGLTLSSCGKFFRGIAGPSYVKLYNNFGAKKDVQKALNAFYQKHPETIIKYEEWVKRGFTTKVSLQNPDSIRVFEKDSFHRVIDYDTYTQESWNLKDLNDNYIFSIDISNCDGDQKGCDLCLKSVNGKNYEMKSKERSAALKVFQAEIIPKIKELIVENKAKSAK